MKYLNNETKKTYVVKWLDCITHIDDKEVARGYAEEKIEKYGSDLVGFYEKTTTVTWRCLNDWITVNWAVEVYKSKPTLEDKQKHFEKTKMENFKHSSRLEGISVEDTNEIIRYNDRMSKDSDTDTGLYDE